MNLGVLRRLHQFSQQFPPNSISMQWPYPPCMEHSSHAWDGIKSSSSYHFLCSWMSSASFSPSECYISCYLFLLFFHEIRLFCSFSRGVTTQDLINSFTCIRYTSLMQKLIFTLNYSFLSVVSPGTSYLFLYFIYLWLELIKKRGLKHLSQSFGEISWPS